MFIYSFHQLIFVFYYKFVAGLTQSRFWFDCNQISLIYLQSNILFTEMLIEYLAYKLKWQIWLPKLSHLIFSELHDLNTEGSKQLNRTKKSESGW